MKRHLCLLGDANSVHLRRWAQEMLARGWRVSVVTARPQPMDDVEQRGVEFVESLGHGPMVAVDEEIRALIKSLELPVQGGPTYAAVSEGTQFT